MYMRNTGADALFQESAVMARLLSPEGGIRSALARVRGCLSAQRRPFWRPTVRFAAANKSADFAQSYPVEFPPDISDMA
jgi:hypothetical protein